VPKNRALICDTGP